MTIPTPWTSPKQIKVQPAPCQRPDRKKVTSVGIEMVNATSRTVLGCSRKYCDRRKRRRKLSHIGLYRYIVKNRIIVMCHCRQNWASDLAAYGMRKLLGS